MFSFGCVYSGMGMLDCYDSRYIGYFNGEELLNTLKNNGHHQDAKKTNDYGKNTPLLDMNHDIQQGFYTNRVGSPYGIQPIAYQQNISDSYSNTNRQNTPEQTNRYNTEVNHVQQFPSEQSFEIRPDNIVNSYSYAQPTFSQTSIGKRINQPSSPYEQTLTDRV